MIFSFEQAELKYMLYMCRKLDYMNASASGILSVHVVMYTTLDGNSSMPAECGIVGRLVVVKHIQCLETSRILITNLVTSEA
jgi:hypothetical protein